jgi:hypothetical protein
MALPERSEVGREGQGGVKACPLNSCDLSFTSAQEAAAEIWSLGTCGKINTFGCHWAHEAGEKRTVWSFVDSQTPYTYIYIVMCPALFLKYLLNSHDNGFCYYSFSRCRN